MKRSALIPLLIALAMSIPGCSSHKAHHGTDMPDPQSFNAHFGDMDADDDDLVTWEEFAGHFEHAEPKVFDAIDLNQDRAIDHDEWHQFKAAHGLKHKD